MLDLFNSLFIRFVTQYLIYPLYHLPYLFYVAIDIYKLIFEFPDRWYNLLVEVFQVRVRAVHLQLIMDALNLALIGFER